MRSDFIGDCTEFPGLAEAVNEGQYLIPRMTRDEAAARPSPDRSPSAAARSRRVWSRGCSTMSATMPTSFRFFSTR